MRIRINNELHTIIYIEYLGNIPHEVVTLCYVDNLKCEPYWRPYYWSFFANGGDRSDIRYYNSGSGGSSPYIQAPQWADGYIGEYWLENGGAFNGEPKNSRKLPKPKRLKYWSGSSINPFVAGEKTSCHEYCEECGFESTEICDKHQYIDRDGDLRYKHKNHH